MAEQTDGDKSLPTLVTELYELVLAYLRQETLEPVKGLGRFVGFGLAGSVVTGIGSVLLLLGGLRAIQSETGRHLQGSWSWAPYGITAVGCVLLMGLGMAVRGRGAAARGSRS